MYIDLLFNIGAFRWRKASFGTLLCDKSDDARLISGGDIYAPDTVGTLFEIWVESNKI